MNRLGLALLTLLGIALAVRAGEPDARGLEFFEKKIRPVLVESCYQCHSAESEKKKKLRGGLLVDSRAGLLKGGDTGPAIVPGKPAEGTLLQSLRHTGDVRMPPKGKLSDAVIADFEAWVRMGAPDPRGSTTAKARTISIEEGRRFWAYQPPTSHRPPVVKDTAWARGPVDHFILAGLEAKGLRPVADADRETLVRRLYFDLVGLPPSPEQVEAFVKDSRPGATEELVDRLLASPHFGERWGRHWLDLTRFAESLTLRGFVLKDAWRYRDYVIESFNEDRPLDRMIREQVAGDLMGGATLAERRRNLTALTFLSLGNTNLEEQDKKQLRMDVVDEQLETIGKAFLAQTIGCARCHDHKFDPIPARDYYALAGILRNTRTLEHANVSKWLEAPLPGDPAVEAEFRKWEQAVAALQARIQEERKKVGASAKEPVKPGKAKVLAIKDVPGIVVDDTQAKKVGEWKLSQFSGRYIGEGYSHDLDADKGNKTLTFIPELPKAGKYEVRLAYSPGTNRAPAVPVTIMSADGEKTVEVNQKEAPPIDGLFLSLGQYNFERNGQGYVLISNEGTKGHVIVDAVVFIPVEKLDQATTPPERTVKPGATPAADTLKQLEEEMKRLRAQAPPRDTVMTVREEEGIEDTRVHIRGSVHNLGEKAPRGFLQVATRGTPPAFPSKESGRRELAEWLASRENPLTARVFVNRAWHWLFGEGLVRTTDNFGTTGETPSHPELLDFLAVRFVEEGWSVKRLVREMILSRTYQLSTASTPALTAADPENRLLGRMNRRRLEAECIRDAILSVSGQLTLDRGGPTFKTTLTADYGYRHSDTRRSVYSPIFRNSLPELFEVFDFADPSVTTGRRNVSTVAPQALFLMNHPFIIEQSRQAATRLLAEKGLDEAERITRAYRLVLGRPPSEGERQVARKFLAGESNTPAAWALMFQSLFASMDFRYLH